jgi:hypothetical protein
VKKTGLLALLFLGLGLVAGLWHLFNLRFEAGDVYPAYSSLRADPLGARALYESLDDLLEVRRHFEPIVRLADGRQTTLLHLGESPEGAQFVTNEFRALEKFVRTGGRLVMAFSPVIAAPRVNRFVPPTPPPAPAPPPPVTGTPPRRGTNSPTAPPAVGPPVPRRSRSGPSSMMDPQGVSVADYWLLSFEYAPLERNADGSLIPAQALRVRARSTSSGRGPSTSPGRAEGEAGPERETEATRPEDNPPPDARSTAGAPEVPLAWPVHTALFFRPLDPSWRVIAARREGTNEYPVLIERTQGRGSIVLCADAYPFSNEALRSAREPRLLAWFVGSSDQVIFEETHLGTSDDPGIAALARRYRLHGLAVALVVLAGLFIWHNAVPFVPPPEEQLAGESTHQVAGKDSAEGFIHLLRRNVAPVDLLKVCLEQWNLTTGGRKPSLAKLQAMQQLVDEQNALDPRQRNPVQTYHRFCEILAQRT